MPKASAPRPVVRDSDGRQTEQRARPRPAQGGHRRRRTRSVGSSESETDAYRPQDRDDGEEAAEAGVDEADEDEADEDEADDDDEGARRVQSESESDPVEHPPSKRPKAKGKQRATQGGESDTEANLGKRQRSKRPTGKGKQLPTTTTDHEEPQKYTAKPPQANEFNDSDRPSDYPAEIITPQQFAYRHRDIIDWDTFSLLLAALAPPPAAPTKKTRSKSAADPDGDQQLTCAPPVLTPQNEKFRRERK